MVSRYFDLGLAAIICLLAGGTALHTYVSLQDKQQQPAIFEGIAPGTARSYLLQNGQCVGEVNVSFTEAALNEVRSKTILRTVQHGRDSALSIETLAYFNPLGQMVSGDIEVHFDSVYFLLRSQNVNPLQISVKAELAGHDYKREFTLPGPIEMERNESSGAYQFSYFYLEHFFPKGIPLQGKELKERWGISAVSADEDPQACQTQAAIEISELLAEAQEAAAKLSAWNPAGLWKTPR